MCLFIVIIKIHTKIKLKKISNQKTNWLISPSLYMFNNLCKSITFESTSPTTVIILFFWDYADSHS